ncbi:phage major capsid protein [Bordetella petrii]|uniref:phage major capsid protein n=1 Tax=Bordetella petrii TaxID=94624 RepID=UPI001A95C147|nr:phage major capsid protein [Bordetella petrii]MBO1110681.1 phage major capsid protein [Bordetella petrii]
MNATTAISVPGRTAARALKALGITGGRPAAAIEYVTASTRWSDATRIERALDVMGTGNQPGLAGGAIAADYMDAVRPATIVGRLPLLRQIPLYTRMVTGTGTTAYWINEADPKTPTTASYANGGSLKPYKVAALAVVTQELVKASEVDTLLTRDLNASLVEAVDLAFISPSNAGVVGERPASVTNAATAIPATNDPAVDIAALIDAFAGKLETAAFVMNPRIAARLNLRGRAFETIHALGGSLVGIPVVTSSAVPFDSAGSPIALLDQDGIEISGLDDATLRTSEQAIVFTAEGDTATSLWQSDLIGYLAETPVAWRARTGSVAVINGASYG